MKKSFVKPCVQFRIETTIPTNMKKMNKAKPINKAYSTKFPPE
ncbi:MAG: hypothetical protein ACTSUL_02465 [Promethearchaeota archaeon]